MKALVSNSLPELEVISSKIHQIFNSSDLKYVGYNFGEPIKHPIDEKFALVLLNEEKYNEFLLEKLSQGDVNLMQNLDESWFQKNEKAP